MGRHITDLTQVVMFPAGFKQLCKSWGLAPFTRASITLSTLRQNFAHLQHLGLGGYALQCNYTGGKLLVFVIIKGFTWIWPSPRFFIARGGINFFGQGDDHERVRNKDLTETAQN